MRVLVVSNLYPPIVFGGYELLCRQIVELLRERGHEVDVLTTRFRAEELAPTPGVERRLHLTTDFPRPGEDVRFVDFRLTTLHRVAEVNQRITSESLGRKAYDLVFCWCMNRLSLGPVLAARAAGVPVCYTVNDEHPKQFRFLRAPDTLRERLKALAERILWRKATLRAVAPVPTTVISQALKDSLVAQGTPLEEAQVIHQGIPLGQFPFDPAWREPGEPLRVLYVGQLSESKGVHTVIRAVGETEQRRPGGLDLTIVGSGVPAYERSLRALVDECGIGSRTRFTGSIPHGEIGEVYQRHHVLVFASECREAFGLSHVEAMASGCAVVSTTRGGCAELVRHGENALAFESGNALHLASRLEDLLDSESLRRALVRGGRRWVEEHHDLAAYCTALEAFMAGAQQGAARTGGAGPACRPGSAPGRTGPGRVSYPGGAGNPARTAGAPKRPEPASGVP